jgi:hypothetical protein
MGGRMSSRTALVLLAVLQLTCNQVILTAPSGATITVVANPGFIAANGEVSVISALLIEPSGSPVPDGTVVQFFTTLGSIDEQGKTNDGVARVNLVSDSRSGSADITASSGPVSGTTTVTIGSGRPSLVIVAADPVHILSNGPRQSRIVANVFDASGNAVRSVPVFFSVDGTPSTEFMASGGSPIFTDTNGQAADFLQTKYPRDAATKTVTVTAQTANNITGSVEVTLN